MDPLKILIADDETEILKIMENKIRAAGYDVVSVCDGEEAWEKIVAEDPDIILLDLIMPKMDGYSVLAKLRESPPSSKYQPVIIVSAKGELGDIQKGLSLEADHYLSKPCSMEDVIKGIRLMSQLIPQRKTAKEMETHS